MRIFMAAMVAVAFSHGVQAEEQRPQDSQWLLQACRNPGLSYEVKKSTEPGSVSALFDIEVGGRVDNIRIKDPEKSRGMDTYVASALRHWRYYAYIKNGVEAKRSDVAVTFTYGIDGKQDCTRTLLPGLPSTAGDPTDPHVALKSCPTLIYPKPALDRRQWGIVTMGFDITPEGEVTNVSLAKPSGSDILDSRAVESLKHWHFHKFLKSGKPVARNGMKISFAFGTSLPYGQEEGQCVVGREAEVMSVNN